MRDPLVEVDINDVVRGSGTLTSGEIVVPIASFSLARLKHEHTSLWSFTAHTAKEYWGQLHSLIRGPIAFDGETDGQHRISIPQLYWTRHIRGRLDADVPTWYRNLASPPAQPSSQYVTIHLSETPIALPEVDSVVQDWTGEIRSERPKPPPVTWRSSLGEIRFSRRFDYEQVLVGGTESTLQIGVPTFSLKLESNACFSDIDQLMSKLEAEMKDALSVISFLSRRHVRWYQMTIMSQWHGKAGSGIAEAEWNRYIGGSPSKKRTYPLINAYRASHDVLGTMIDKFRELTWKEAASSAITYLIESHHSSFVAPRFSNAFTALEALVSGIGDVQKSNKTLGASRFGRLTKRLKGELRAFGEEEGLNTDTIQEMVDKLSEIKRRPIVNQVTDLIEQLQVPWEDLWPPDTPLRESIKDAFARRNRFVHAGKLPSGAQAHVDAARIHAVAERILFISIGGDFDWQDFRTSGHLENLSER